MRSHHFGRDGKPGGHHHRRHFEFNSPFALPHVAHALWGMIGRHRHGGGGRFGGGGGPGGLGGFGDGPDDMGGMPRSRKFSSDDLQLLLLAMLEEAPRHGYELIKALADRSNGFYTPSPGMVYPALTYLEELGYATVELEGNRKRYALSDGGREYLAANRERVDLMLARLLHFARKMDLVRRAYAGEEPDEAAAGSGWAPELVAARRALKRALLLRTEASQDEQRRIAEILARATAEIEQGDARPQVSGTTR
ncbi:PadR family transcriptional regulator [Caballeronia grimmiae]|uniref:PadR family transcriptional regulator n=2 Tax=Caballeronia grimmiae TaxID=1071679 RepID=A0A069P8I5_9BURK|nr:PadR family transcriptional regulator [Caballeronia grimmiae]KDR33576.1 PadR family transcriptional regulator [Caballeronia grimmiae]